MPDKTPQGLPRKPGEPGGEKALRDKLGASFDKVVDAETRGQILNCIAPVMAGAMAEAALREARRIQVEVNWAVTVRTPSRVGSVAKWLDEHIAALERAAEDKA